MNFKNLSILIVLISTFACSPLKKLPGLENQAKTAIEQNNYWQAYEYLTQYMSICKTGAVEPDMKMISQMATVCSELGKVDEAITYYEKMVAKDPSNLESYATFLQNNDEYEKEYKLWQQQAANIQNKDLQTKAFTRQLELVNELEKYDDAKAIWESKPESVSPSADAYFAYVQAADKAGHTKTAFKTCNQFLKAYPDNVNGMEWKAKYLCENAEKRYQAEMTKYNKKKTATTYAYLRRELKKISADFRSSKVLFEKLRRINPDETSYIKYLKNIYLRLDMKSQAAQMDKLLK